MSGHVKPQLDCPATRSCPRSRQLLSGSAKRGATQRLTRPSLRRWHIDPLTTPPSRLDGAIILDALDFSRNR